MNESRKFVQVLVGPRQVGKTTLINQLLSKRKSGYHYASADAVPATDQRWLEQQWNIARIRLTQESSPEFLLAIDEIQKIDNWSEMVKRLWDEDTVNKSNIKVILLGSSRLLVQKGLTESLAGRFEITYMGHWSFSEMQEAFDWNVNQYVWFGGYPGSEELIKDERRWKNYIQHAIIETSILKDILMLTRIDKPALMKRLFELGCSHSGERLSFNKMLGQLEDAGNTVTLAHYLDLLHTAGLLSGLQKYSVGKLSGKSSSPKFQVHNTALLSAQSDTFFENVLGNPKEWGRIVESSVGAHLINHGIMEGFDVYYWREGNNEIDFVIAKKKKIVGLEVKSGGIQKSSGLTAFQNRFEPQKALIVGNSGIPWQEFLKMNPNDIF